MTFNYYDENFTIKLSEFAPYNHGKFTTFCYNYSSQEAELIARYNFNTSLIQIHVFTNEYLLEVLTHIHEYTQEYNDEELYQPDCDRTGPLMNYILESAVTVNDLICDFSLYSHDEYYTWKNN